MFLGVGASSELKSLELINAIEEADLGKVKSVLESVNEKHVADLVNVRIDGLHITAIQLASHSNDPASADILKLLIECGADANASDRLGRTALHYATVLGCVENVLVLLKEGAANPNATYKFDCEFSEGSCKRRSKLSSKLPLPETFGRTPLHNAVKSGKFQIVKALIDHGAQASIADEHLHTPILLAGANLDTKNAEAVADYEQIVEILVKEGADVNVLNTDTKTSALHHAVRLGNARVAQLLIDADALQIISCCGDTPLHEAAGNGNLEVCEILINQTKSCVTMTDSAGRTPVHKACYGGHRLVLALLLDHGGDLSTPSYCATTPADLLFSRIPRPLNFIAEYLNTKVTHNNVGENEVNFKLNLEFCVLAPPMNGQMEVMSSLITAANDDQKLILLKHPLIESYLRIKWKRLRIFFLLLVILHASFVLSLSVFATLHTSLGKTTIAMTISRIVLIFTSLLLVIHGLVQVHHNF